jgi:hypothetical protein
MLDDELTDDAISFQALARWMGKLVLLGVWARSASASPRRGATAISSTRRLGWSRLATASVDRAEPGDTSDPNPPEVTDQSGTVLTPR